MSCNARKIKGRVWRDAVLLLQPAENLQALVRRVSVNVKSDGGLLDFQQNLSLDKLR